MPKTTIQQLNEAITRNGGVECENNPDLFYPEEITDWITKKLAIAHAKEICGRCPLKVLCATYALENQEAYGIWGSLLPEER